jgi:putative ABC transport system permease protein
MARELTASRLHPGDVVRTSTVGLRTRKNRSFLSALGITIGIAAMVAVLGLSESSKSALIAELDRLGTNLISVQAGTGIGFGNATLPATATAMIKRIPEVQEASAIVNVSSNVYRSDRVPSYETAGLSVRAVDTNLLATLKGGAARGRFLDAASGAYPTTVLGAVAAQRLGIADLSARPRVWIGGTWFSVVGILDSLPLNPDLDRAALVGIPAAETFLGSDGVPSTIEIRTDPDAVDSTLSVLAATANPENPDQVEATRPTDALEAKAAATNAFTELLLGLGAVALLVGGVGIANIMVISVLERRSEIGLRRALGATRRHIAVQFLTESLLIATLGGVAGVTLGALITVWYARFRGWGVLLPVGFVGGGMAAALLIGAVAGLYPAVRAAKLSPTEALRTG